jgi:uncharacterized protein YhaN
MALEGLTIEGFGQFAGYTLEGLSPGLTVVHGPNEAGKSSLMNFCVHVLFGPERGAKPKALAGGRLGGRLRLRGPAGELSIERLGDEEPRVRWSGQPEEVGQEAVMRALGNVHRGLFRAVYSFALADLGGFQKLGDEALRDRLFTGSLVGAGKSVAAADKRLAEREESLWRPRASSRLKDLLERQDRLAAELQDAREEAKGLERLDFELEERGRQLERARAEALAAARKAQRLERRREALAPQRELARHLAELGALPLGLELRPGVLETAQRLESERRSAGSALQHAEQRLRERQSESDGLPQPGPLLSVAAELEALQREAGARTPEQAEGRRTSREQAEARLRQALLEAGLADAAALGKLRLDETVLAELRRAGQRARDAEQAERSLGSLDSEANGLEERLERARKALEGLPQDALALELREEVLALRREAPQAENWRRVVGALDQRIEALRREIEALELELGPSAHKVGADEAKHGAWAAEARGHGRALADAQSEQRRAESERARAEKRLEAARQACAAEAAPDPLDPGQAQELFDGADGFLTAAGEGRRLTGELEQLEREQRACLDSLGAPWTEALLAEVHSDAGRLERLRSALRGVFAAESERQRAATALSELEERCRQAGIEAAAAAPGAGADPARQLAELLEAADEAEPRLQARTLRAMRAAPAAGPGRGLLLIIAVLLLVLGALAIQAGAAEIGAGVLALGLLLAAASLLWFPRASAAAAGADGGLDGGAERGLEALLQRLGLPADADLAALAQRRRELSRQKRDAELLADLARARQRAAEAKAKIELERGTWRQSLSQAGWPATIEPAAFDGLLPGVLEGRRLSKRRQELLASRGQAEGAQADWLRRAEPLAARLGFPTPADETQARRLIGALRQQRQQAGDRQQRRIAAQRALEDAQGAVQQSAQALEAASQLQGRLEQRTERLRADLKALGAPPDLALEQGEDWLRAARRLGERRRDLAGLEQQREAQAKGLSAFDARWQACLVERLACTGPGAMEAAWSRVQRAEGYEKTRQDAEGDLRMLERQARELRVKRDLIQERRRSLAGAAEAWRAQLVRAGLPEDLGPLSLETCLDAVRRAREALADFERSDGEWQGGAEADARWFEELARLCDLAGLEAPVDLRAAQARVAPLARALAEEREREGRRASAAQELEKARKQRAEAHDEHEAKTRELADLLAELGAASVAELERLDREFQARARAEERVASARRARDAALGEWAGAEEELQALQAPDEARWEFESKAAVERQRGAEAEAEGCIRERARLEAERTRLGQSRSVPELELELGIVRTQVEAARRELAVVVLARALLARTLKRFRDEHQPKILRRAGRLLEVATEGTYRAIEPDDLGRPLIVEDATGGRRRAEELSTGTAELLYLVLRLGLVMDLTEGRGVLPLVLDDVLVNLDPERASAVARLLGEIAAEQQVLLLTCRPETRDLLRATVAGARVIDLPRFAGRQGPVAGSDSEPRASGEAARKLAPTRLLEALGGSDEPLGKQELLERSGVAEAHWLGAIRELETRGLIEASGEGRGRRYRHKR